MKTLDATSYYYSDDYLKLYKFSVTIQKSIKNNMHLVESVNYSIKNVMNEYFESNV